MRTVRVDSSPLIAGRCIVSAYAGHGVLGADAPSSGLHGPGLFSGVVHPDEDADEFRAQILTVPEGLTLLSINELGQIEAEGPAGTYPGTWRLYKNAAAQLPDPSTYTIVIGASLGGAVTLDGPSASGGFSVAGPSALSGGATLDGITVSGGLASGVLPANITLQPVDATVPAGRPATFVVGYEGTAPVAVQWLRDGQAIDGATAGTYTLSPAQLADSGAIFTATVTNAHGAVTSSGAELTVLEALDMYTLRAPKDQVAYVGGFAPKPPAGVLWMLCDFKRYTSAPSNPTVTIRRVSGEPDANPSAMLSGAPTASGTMVFQKLIGGVEWCDYELLFEVDGPGGTKYSMVGLLPVRPPSNTSPAG